jgi:hypothetical protein
VVSNYHGQFDVLDDLPDGEATLIDTGMSRNTVLPNEINLVPASSGAKVIKNGRRSQLLG